MLVIFVGGLYFLTYDSCKILSPVGSMSVLEAAVFSGADFVYLSGKRYGARAYAENFSYDEISRAVSFCHDYDVKVFVTVNVSILEREIFDVIDYVYYLYVQGVDGVIVQDIGLASIVHDLFPDLSIHASTQMTVYDYSFVRWLCDNGYDSANLSREVPLSRIRSISSKLKRFGHDINLEVFAHGALCYCYSGQCLMSSFYGGRSGNRGLCAQPCRMRYTFKDYYNTLLADDNYLLSTKDLCTLRNVDDFIDAGVNCLKIEGRMKSEEYVSGTTFSYKNAVSKCSGDDDYLLLNLAFNRGLTEGYISGKESKDVVGRNRSGNTGYPIGKVIKCDGSKVTVKFTGKRFPTKIVNGDGLKFEYDDYSCGMYVSKIYSQSKSKIVLGVKKGLNIEKDSMVYITYSKYLKDRTKEIINNKNIHKTNIKLEISVNDESQMQVKAYTDNDEKIVTYVSDEKFQKAKNKPLTKDRINQQLQKTGSTTYNISTITYKNFPENLFMPISSINNIRRNIIEKIDKEKNRNNLTKERKQEIKRNVEEFKLKQFKKDNIEKEAKWNVYISTTEQAEIIKEFPYISKVYYDSSFNHHNMKEYAEEIYDELEKVNALLPDKTLIWILPQLLLDEDMPHISEILLKLENNNIDIKIQTDNIAIAENLNVKSYTSNLNIYNNYTLKKITQNNKIIQTTVSNEISLKDVRLLSNSYCDLEYIVFGHVQLMLTEDNFEDLIDEELTNTYYLIDKRNNKFKIKKDCYDHSHIYDYRILKLDNEIEQLKNTCVTDYSIDARFFSTNDTEKILDYYEKVIENKKGIKLELQENNNFFNGIIEKGVYNR